jgi:hypothetical protein
MSDEAEIGFAGATDRPGHSGRSSGEQSPLQTRAAFLKNRSWELVTSLNRGACARSGAQHGFNSETQRTTAQEWEARRTTVLTLDETLEYLRSCHRRAPFLFYNGNTFADIGRQIAAAVFADLPPSRVREIISAIAHFVAGVLDHESMAQMVENLCEAADFHPGDRVATLRGSMSGTILKILPDGRLLWRADSGPELTALPESLICEKNKKHSFTTPIQPC